VLLYNKVINVRGVAHGRKNFLFEGDPSQLDDFVAKRN